MKPSSDIDFFKSLFILVLGFAYDYWSLRTFCITEQNKGGEILGVAGTVIAGFFLLIAVFGLFGGIAINYKCDNLIYIETTDKIMAKFSVPMNYILYFLAIFPTLAVGEIWTEHCRHH